ncbi:hypothetical protein Gocc_1469 [Gaiella occulta]|uniref:Uncharacterized protein n=2 Tax=Gaiella occulta TaxID=1002870 RepID=A0A7M2YXX5_9ACTN|nr:hypothetical protein Gocc_1469 [Gaiella occulta]
MCHHLLMPRLPTNPVSAGFLLYKAWRRLPAKQRRQLLDAARRHGPAAAAALAAVAKTRARKKP